MSKRNKIDTKEIGLDISIVLAKYLLKTDHLHYGYWTDDLERNIFNIPKAQEKYSEFIISHIPDNISSILDVGCGSGYLLDQIAGVHPHIKLAGADINAASKTCRYEYFQEDIQNLSFADSSFDVVTCCHTLEHVLEVAKAVKELQRVCGKTLIIVVPCQRYYFYTLDEHLNFFTYKEQLISLLADDYFRLEKCQKVWGDWVVVLRRV